MSKKRKDNFWFWVNVALLVGGCFAAIVSAAGCFKPGTSVAGTIFHAGTGLVKPGTATGACAKAELLIIPAIIGMAISATVGLMVPGPLRTWAAGVFVLCGITLGLALAAIKYAEVLAIAAGVGALGFAIYAGVTRKKVDTEHDTALEQLAALLPDHLHKDVDIALADMPGLIKQVMISVAEKKGVA